LRLLRKNLFHSVATPGGNDKTVITELAQSFQIFILFVFASSVLFRYLKASAKLIDGVVVILYLHHIIIMVFSACSFSFSASANFSFKGVILVSLSSREF
jgi:hypothetical protein